MNSHHFCCKHNWNAVVIVTQINAYVTKIQMVVQLYDVGPVLKQYVQKLGYM